MVNLFELDFPCRKTRCLAPTGADRTTVVPGFIQSTYQHIASVHFLVRHAIYRAVPFNSEKKSPFFKSVKQLVHRIIIFFFLLFQ
jgi:hypothetical protein